MDKKHVRNWKRLRTLLLICMTLFAALANGQSWTAQPVGEGDFYIRNVYNGKFLGRGTNFGTRASYDLQGLCWKLTRVSDNTYTLYQGSDKPGYLFNDGNKNFYVDGAASQSVKNWTFTPVDGLTNTYTIKDNNGRILRPSGGDEYFSSNSELSDTPTEKYYFTLVSKAEREYLTRATQKNPVDMTYKVYNQSMNYYEGEFKSLGKWEFSKDGGEVAYRCGNSGTTYNTCMQVKNGTFNLSQTLNDMPNGQYTVRMQGFYRVGDGADNPSKAAAARAAGNEVINAYLYANDQSAKIASIFDEKATTRSSVKHSSADYNIGGTTYYVPTTEERASNCFIDGEFDNSVTTDVTGGTLKIGLRKEVANDQDWTIFDNFRLLYAPTFAVLDQLVADAKAKDNKPADLVSLLTEIAALDRPNTNKATVDHYVEALTNFADILIPEPVEGYIYTIVDGQKKFFSRGAEHNTRLILADYGIPMRIAATDLNGVTTLTCLDSQRKLYSVSGTEVYTDGSDNNISYKMSAADDGGYYIQCNNEKSQDGYFGPRDASRPFIVSEKLTQENAYVWHIMTPADYNTYLADLQLAATEGTALAAARLTKEDVAEWDGSVVKSNEDTETATITDNFNNNKAYEWNYTDLTKGLYRVSLQAMVRNGSPENHAAQAQMGYDCTLAYLTANGQTMLIHSIMDGKSTTDMGGSRSLDLNGTTYYIPDNLTSIGNVMSTTDNYLNQMYVYITDGKLDIKLGNDSHVPSQWMPFRDLIVEKMSFQASIDNAKQELDSYNTIAHQALDHSTFDATISGIKTAMDGATNKARIDEFKAQAQEAFFTLLATYANNTANGYFDLTSLLTNPSFDTNTDGWTMGGDSPSVGCHEGNCEKLTQRSFSMTQTVKNLPAGPYMLAAQAMFRTRSNEVDADNWDKGIYDPKAFLTLADQQTPIRSRNSDARYTPSCTPAQSGLADVAGGGNLSVPNGQTGFGLACEQGRYWNVLSATLNAEQAADLTLGIRQDAGALSSGAWLVFDNFHLLYGGKANVTLHADDTKAPIDFMLPNADVTLQKELPAGQWTPICLPVSGQVPAGVTMARILGANGQTVNVQPVSTIEAGKPYFVKADAATSSLTFTNAKYDPTQSDNAPAPWYSCMVEGSYAGYGVTIGGQSATTYTVEPIDFASVDYTYNVENDNAHAFMSNVTYTLDSSSAIDTYNAGPVWRRDWPNVAYVPIAPNNEDQTLTLNDGEKDVYTTTVPAGADHVELGFLIPGQTYTYTVGANAGTIRPQGALRMVKAIGVSNIRDMGGKTTAEGHKVKYGLIYRGGEFNGTNNHWAPDATKRLLRDIGIRADLDLRSWSVDNKAVHNSSALDTIAGNNVVPSIFYRASNQLFSSVDALETDTTRTKWSGNLDFIMDHVLADEPVYYHCVWGADRTGVMGLLINGVLGVTESDILKDYELTSFSWAGKRNMEGNGMQNKIRYVIEHSEGTTLKEHFEDFYINYLGLDRNKVARFQAKMLGLEEPTIEGEWNEPADMANYTGLCDPGFVYEEIGGHTHGKYNYNTWSREQESDQSGLIKPFFEDWTTDDAELGNATLTKTLTGMPEGYYDISARVRVYDLNSANGKTYNAEAGVQGLSMIANEANVAITTGKQITEGSHAGKGFYGDYHIVGNVTDDGLLKVGFKLDGADFSWLAFDDLKVAYIGQNDSYTSTTDGVTTLCGNAAFDVATIVTDETRVLDVTRLAHHNAMQIATTNSPNVLIKANVGQVGNDHNVIIDGMCDNLLLTDKQSFATDAAFTAAKASYSRTMPSGSIWGTICLPYVPNEYPNVTFYTIASWTSQILNLTEADPEAGVPYIFSYENEGEAQVNATDVRISSSDAGMTDAEYRLVGTYDNLTLKSDAMGDGVSEIYYIKSNKFWAINKGEGGNPGTATIPAFRAYIASVASNPVRELRIMLDGKETTGIEREQIFNALTEDVIYNLAGQRIGKAQRGVNIINGKKVLK